MRGWGDGPRGGGRQDGKECPPFRNKGDRMGHPRTAILRKPDRLVLHHFFLHDVRRTGDEVPVTSVHRLDVRCTHRQRRDIEASRARDDTSGKNFLIAAGAEMANQL
jgi:hypothetical protein